MKFEEFYKKELSEKVLPLGFTTDDVESLEDFYNDEKENGKLIDINIEEADEPIVTDIDIKKLKQQKLQGPEKGVEIAKRMGKLIHRATIVDEKGKVINDNKLRKIITQRPLSIISQNRKLEKSGKTSNQIFYDSTLPSYQGLFVDEKTGDFKVVRTCPAAGVCTKFCYASRGGFIMFPTSNVASTRLVNFLMNDPEGFKNKMISEIKQAQSKNKDKQVVVRWHDSGDFLSEKYLQIAFDVARQTPETIHYAYTKQVPMIKRLESEKPKNFKFTFSFGGIFDPEIDIKKEKHTKVVPTSLFKDLKGEREVEQTGGGMTVSTVRYSPDEIKTLKDRVSKEFGLDPKTIITYDEMLEIPEGTERKWNVLVWKGHGDDAAIRDDVLGVYLLFH